MMTGGNVEKTTDANLNETEIAYDTDYELYPVRVKTLGKRELCLFQRLWIPRAAM